MYLCIREEAARLKAEIFAIGGIEDHVHVLLRLPATVAVATLVKQLKGSSSHLANHEVLPRGFKWQGGYSASSVSRRVLPIVRNYVLRQEEHHRDGTTHPTLNREAAAEPEMCAGAGIHSPRRRTSRSSRGELCRLRI